jgi:hypothetical protein
MPVDRIRPNEHVAKIMGSDFSPIAMEASHHLSRIQHELHIIVARSNAWPPEGPIPDSEIQQNDTALQQAEHHIHVMEQAALIGRSMVAEMRDRLAGFGAGQTPRRDPSETPYQAPAPSPPPQEEQGVNAQGDSVQAATNENMGQDMAPPAEIGTGTGGDAGMGTDSTPPSAADAGQEQQQPSPMEEHLQQPAQGQVEEQRERDAAAEQPPPDPEPAPEATTPPEQAPEAPFQAPPADVQEEDRAEQGEPIERFREETSPAPEEVGEGEGGDPEFKDDEARPTKDEKYEY